METTARLEEIRHTRQRPVLGRDRNPSPRMRTVFDAVELVQPFAAMNCPRSVRADSSALEFPLNLFVPLYFQPFIPTKGFVSPASMWS